MNMKIHENTFYIASLLGFFSQPRNLTPKNLLVSTKIKTTCLFHLWVTPYLIFVWALFSDRCGCCFADLSRTPGVWIKRSNGQCWFQMRTFAISEQKLLLQLQAIGSQYFFLQVLGSLAGCLSVMFTCWPTPGRFSARQLMQCDSCSKGHENRKVVWGLLVYKHASHS